MSVVIDKSTFWRRLRAIHSAWTKGRTAEPQQLQWADIDAIAVIKGSADDGAVEGRTYLLMMYLLGYEFTDTLMVLTKTKLVIVTSSKKLKLWSPFATPEIPAPTSKWCFLSDPRPIRQSTSQRC